MLKMRSNKLVGFDKELNRGIWELDIFDTETKTRSKIILNHIKAIELCDKYNIERIMPFEAKKHLYYDFEEVERIFLI